MAPETLALIRDRQIAKGDVLEVARLAGIMATKRTAELIPLCHSLGLDSAELQLARVAIRSELHGKRFQWQGSQILEAHGKDAGGRLDLLKFSRDEGGDEVVILLMPSANEVFERPRCHN